ncbi:MAG: glycosyltransferase [Oscillospiraceae bacterium]|nr:glycosyltransferase [Oscillospiraceae bacterium]
MNSKETLTFSVIIPAHNEEQYIARCIRSVRRAVKESGRDAEIIVVCNRCTDRTEQIAKSLGAVTLRDETRCIAAVRNAGIRAAKGRYIVTIDSDNRMTKGTLAEIYRLMQTGRYIGGGAPIRFERYSVPLYLNDLLCRAGFAVTGLYSGIFWAERKTFLKIGGFADKRAMEDVYTAKALKRYGKVRGRAYTCLKENVLINSVRKYDDLGDWLYFRLIAQNFGALVRAAFGDRSGADRLIDELFYDYNG